MERLYIFYIQLYMILTFFPEIQSVQTTAEY